MAANMAAKTQKYAYPSS